MRDITRHAAALSAAAGLLTAATLLAPYSATAAAELRLAGYDVVAAPGSAPRFFPVVQSGPVSGKVVIAVGTKPMTDPAGDGAGFPQGYRARGNECEQPAGYIGVFVCDGAPYQQPDALVPADASDATLYWGFAHLSAGGDLKAAVEAARTAGARPADGRHGTGQVNVTSRAHALLNTIGFDAESVPDGGTAHQQLRVHANDAGQLTLRFDHAQGQLTRNAPPVRIGRVTTDSGATCEIRYATLIGSVPNLACDLEAGDHVIGYDLAGDPGQYAQSLQAHTRYDIYDLGVWDESDVKQSSRPFAVQGRTILPWHGLHARDTTGTLWEYGGTRRATAPLHERTGTGPGWQAYTAVTSLSPYRQGPYSRNVVAPSAATRGLGDLVARDTGGTLWYYHRQTGNSGGDFAPRVKAGTGWNIYDRITGAGDLDRNGSMDLLARDKTGALWLYKGTGSFTGARFKDRVKVGGGWGGYNQLSGGADVTGDGRSDLLARDRAGILWLYQGSGSGTSPYTTRTRVGAGWNAYNQLVVAGDLTDDGKADAVARDTTGLLWLYQGTGKTTTPFVGRVKIGTGWGTYNLVF
ncbi:FG-GAP repeat domain-containing protein [Streptomyces aureus]|uniref:FG-GAP repeat domain-containing protein n=1 Tax=Streptomyces aureus TaxID=193461 RepID=UPI0006E3C2FE|nr:VCBS repeat-containing protein [Streptomyces aureus]